MAERRWEPTLQEHVSAIGKALASPNRVVLLDVLIAGGRSVQDLAATTRLSVANTSSHLQALRHAGLVTSRKEGTTVIYAVADESVTRLVLVLREFVRRRMADLERQLRERFDAGPDAPPVTRDELVDLLHRDEVVLIDVRPTNEYQTSHIQGAISVPLPDLRQRLGDLPRDREVIAYCRGPFCVLSQEAVDVLRQEGLTARRLDDGVAEWRLANLPLAL